LAAGLLVPGVLIAGIFRLPLEIFIAISSSDCGVVQTIACLACVQLFALLWILPQRRALSGGDLAHYAATLPISASVRHGVTVTLLAVANGPINIPVGLTLATQPDFRLNAEAYPVSILLALPGTVLFVQFAVLARRPAAFIAVALADGLLGLGLASTRGASAWLLLLSAIGTLVVASLVPARRRARPATQSGNPVVTLRQPFALSPIFRVQCKSLATHPAATAMGLVVVLGLAVGTENLIGIFQFDERSVPVAIIAMAVIALVFGGIYRTLRNAHLPMESFLMTLPIGPWFWPMRDTLFVLGHGLVPLIFLLLPLILHGLISLFTLSCLVLGYCALIAMLRTTLPLGGRLSVIMATMLAAGWAAAAIAAVAI
jgi:hypothetical protein